MILEDINLNTYTIAISTTAEFSQHYLDFTPTIETTDAQKKVAINTMILNFLDRINDVYRAEILTKFVLHPNNEELIFLDNATQPFTYTGNNDDLGLLAHENQTVTDNVIINTLGSDYDIGHLLHKRNDTNHGVASPLGPCTYENATAVSSLNDPIGDYFVDQVILHEIGHQFGADHTHSCGNDVANFDFEPGSGTTIMSYAGICVGGNVQQIKDSYFHGKNLEQIENNISQHGCHSTSFANLEKPDVNAGLDYVIPANTPFELSGSATNPNSNTIINYCWEEVDWGSGNNLDTGTPPLFRSFPPVSTTNRIFPQITDILNNTQTTGEILPIYNQSNLSNPDGALDFRLTVRTVDPLTGSGVFGWDEMEITVIENDFDPFEEEQIIPFFVTLTNQEGWTSCETETVSWDVAGTNNAPISCANVDILLSTDGGYTYPIVLVNNTPNDGSEAISVPNISSSTVRIKVACSDNIFFNISNEDFSINHSEIYPPINEDIQLDIEHPCIDENNGKVRILNPQDGLIYKWIDPDGNEIDPNDIYQEDLEPGIYQIEIISPSGCIYNQLFILEEETCLNTNCDFDIIVVDECDGYGDNIHPVELIIVSNSNDIAEYSISGSINQTNVTEGSYDVNLDAGDNYFFYVTNTNTGCSKQLIGVVRRCESFCEIIPGIAPTFEIYEEGITICEDHFGEICLAANFNDSEGNPPGSLSGLTYDDGNLGSGSINIINADFDYEANLLCFELVVDNYNPRFVAEFYYSKQGNWNVCGSDFLVINVCPVSTNTYPIFACSDELFVLNDFFESNTYDWEAILPDGVEGETSGTVVDGDGISFTNTTNTNQIIILDVNTIATNPECNCSQSETIQVVLAPTSDINCTSNNLCISEELASDFEDVDCDSGSASDSVCGCDNVLYSSACNAQKSGVQFWTDGGCPNIGGSGGTICWHQDIIYTLRLQNCSDCTDIDWQVENGTIVGGDNFEKEILWDKPHGKKQQSVKVFANQQGVQRELYRKIKFKKAYEIIEDQTVCEGEEVQLWGKGALEYTWYEIGYKGKKKKVHEGKKFRVSPSKTTTYELEMENPRGGCCNGEISKYCFQTVTVSVGDSPFVDAGGDKFISSGSSVTIGTAAVAGLQYDWSPSTGLSATNQAQVQASPTSTKNYTLRVTDPTTECTSSDKVNVRVRNRPGKPTITIGSKPNVIIRPNPVRNFTSIQLQSDGVMNRIEITNIIGNTVYNNDNVQADTQQINCSAWQKGLYKIHVTIDTDTGTEHWYGKMLVL